MSIHHQRCSSRTHGMYNNTKKNGATIAMSGSELPGITDVLDEIRKQVRVVLWFEGLTLPFLVQKSCQVRCQLVWLSSSVFTWKLMVNPNPPYIGHFGNMFVTLQTSKEKTVPDLFSLRHSYKYIYILKQTPSFFSMNVYPPSSWPFLMWYPVSLHRISYMNFNLNWMRPPSPCIVDHRCVLPRWLLDVSVTSLLSQSFSCLMKPHMEMIRDLIRIFNPSVYNMIVYNLGEAWAIWSENPPNNSLHVRLVKPSQFSTCSWKKLNLYINSGFSFLAILAIKYIPPQKSRYNPSIRLCQLCRCLRRLQPTGIRSSRLSRAVSEVRKMRHPGGLYLMI